MYQFMLTSVQSDVMRVLADPLRMRIVELLSREQLCTCHIVDETGARQTNVSNHLRILREAGLVEAEPAGRYTYYRLVPEALDALATSLSSLAVGARTTSDVRRPSCD
jgi:ArsR family transcriptional regulator, arsenate/arsenite/antimonite-responsive transcriptional repressor